MAARSVYKCPVCGENVLASEAVQIKTRRYHKACVEQKMKKSNEKLEKSKRVKDEREKYERALKDSALPKVPKAVSEEEAKAMNSFFEKVKSIQGDCTAKSSALAYKYKEMYGWFTWKGMEQTLDYYFSLLGHMPEENSEIVAIIPWFYDECSSFHEKLDSIESKKVNLDTIYKKKFVEFKPKKREVSLIDISKIGD